MTNPQLPQLICSPPPPPMDSHHPVPAPVHQEQRQTRLTTSQKQKLLAHREQRAALYMAALEDMQQQNPLQEPALPANIEPHPPFRTYTFAEMQRQEREASELRREYEEVEMRDRDITGSGITMRDRGRGGPIEDRVPPKSFFKVHQKSISWWAGAIVVFILIVFGIIFAAVKAANKTNRGD